VGEEHDQVKAHLYFVASDRAATVDTFEKWHDVLDERFEQAIRKLNLSQTERASLARDPATRQRSRFMRLPGFPKRGQEHAAVVYMTAPSARVDFRTLLETREVTISWSHTDDKGQTTFTEYRFGRTCKLVVYKGDDAPKVTPLGFGIWPLARTVGTRGSEPGVRVRYHDVNDITRYAAVDACAFVGRPEQAKEAGRLAALGLRICAGKGQALVEALGHWNDQPTVERIETTVRVPGWHEQSGRKIYVNGPVVVDAPWHYQGPEARVARAGDLASWVTEVSELGDTRVGLIVLGGAFSGALLYPLGIEGFGLHLAGPSSTGKTLLVLLALTVWCHTRHARTWNGTANGIEHHLTRFNDAVIVLDELKEGSPHVVKKMAHAIADGRGRIRSNQRGTDALRTRTWRLVALSTGENSIAEFLGSEAQGGQSVRMIDIPVGRGEACRDAEHAERVDEFIRSGQHFGTAGDAWVRHLVGLEETGWARLRDRLVASQRRLRLLIHSDPELGRIANKLALLETALNEAHIVGLVPAATPKKVREALDWALEAIRTERGSAVSPETRALQLLRQSLVSEPSRWPHEHDYHQAHSVVGIRPNKANPDHVYFCESLLKSNDLLVSAGVSARKWLRWAREQGLSTTKKDRIADLQRNWHLVDLGAVPTGSRIEEEDV